LVASQNISLSDLDDFVIGGQCDKGTGLSPSFFTKQMQLISLMIFSQISKSACFSIDQQAEKYKS
jgi:hypothetical protein